MARRRRRNLVGNLERYSSKGGSQKRRRGQPFHVQALKMPRPWYRIVGSVRRKGRH